MGSGVGIMWVQPKGVRGGGGRNTAQCCAVRVGVGPMGKQLHYSRTKDQSAGNTWIQGEKIG